MAFLLISTLMVSVAQGQGIFSQTDTLAEVNRNTVWRVAEIYVATMGYAPDDEGLQYWVGNIQSGGWQPVTVAQSFFDQPLVKEKYPDSLGYGALIDALYQNIFGRAADDEGRAYWLAELESGTRMRNEMIIALIEGGWANPDAAEDMERFGNRIQVAIAFAEAQGERGIVYSALSSDVQQSLRQAGTDVLAGVSSDPATRDAAIAQIDGLLDAVVGGNTPPVASDLSVQADLAIPLVQIDLIASDADNDTLSYLLVSEDDGAGYQDAYVGPESGRLYANLDGSGQSFALTYRVSDGLAYSQPATVSVTVVTDAEDRNTGDEGVDPLDYGQFPIINPYGDLSGAPGDTPQLPSSVDLSSSFPTPGNQGGQGSCVGWSTAYALKSYQERVEINWELNRQDHLFSPAFVYNQIKVGGCDAGSRISDALELFRATGAATWDKMPYTDTECSTQPSSEALQQAAGFKIASWGRLQGNDSIKAELANHRPVVIGIPAYDSLMNLSGPDSVYNTLSGTNRGGHAVTIVGYDDNSYGGAFKVINSWGTGWGDNGYFWLTYDLGRQGVIQQAYSAQDAENQDDPEPVDPEPPPSSAPNLEIMSWTADYDPSPGGQGELQWRVANTGSEPAPAGAYVNLMLSENADISSGDIFVVYEQIPFDLDPGSAAYRDEGNTIGFSFPDTLAPGTYYMALWVDDLNWVEESNEDDNISFGTDLISITSNLPDLVIQYWYAEWDWAGQGAFLYEVVNSGQSPSAAGWDINLVVTPDEVLGNGNDYFLFYEDVPYELYPGEYVYRDEGNSASFDMSSLPAGVYYMAAWADDLNEVSESNERNNTSWGWGPITWGWGQTASEQSGLLDAVTPPTSRFQTSERSCMLNGKNLSEKPIALRQVEIVATPSGGGVMRLVEGAKAALTESAPITRPDVSATQALRPLKTIESHDIGIFPVATEIPMPGTD
ncbi:C1 family peptidase [Thiorhodococcus minor]|uniref:DUF4214 domain-containing protein n=1 Tax=Thiorhodococcus minor TaxID=57489 RepID=A0A6M0JUA3_9GAMM|nr:C1 family peptidase [Thiorhodococcus minor]NEV61102.1 DUF4214 domain-containing protein [Thiorhodococcus minor]